MFCFNLIPRHLPVPAVLMYGAMSKGASEKAREREREGGGGGRKRVVVGERCDSLVVTDGLTPNGLRA